MSGDSLRLSRLTLSAKLLVTVLPFVVGPGYLLGTLNLTLQHQAADLEHDPVYVIPALGAVCSVAYALQIL